MIERELRLLEKRQVEIRTAQESCSESEYLKLSKELAQINMCLILINDLINIQV